MNRAGGYMKNKNFFIDPKSSTKKLFKKEYGFENSNLSLKVEDKNNSTCIVLSRASGFYVTLSEIEFYDLQNFIKTNKINEAIKQCKERIVESGEQVTYFVPAEKKVVENIPVSTHSSKIVKKVLEKRKIEKIPQIISDDEDDSDDDEENEIVKIKRSKTISISDEENVPTPSSKLPEKKKKKKMVKKVREKSPSPILENYE